MAAQVSPRSELTLALRATACHIRQSENQAIVEDCGSGGFRLIDARISGECTSRLMYIVEAPLKNKARKRGGEGKHGT
jgi:uncharacterized protein YhdP